MRRFAASLEVFLREDSGQDLIEVGVVNPQQPSGGPLGEFAALDPGGEAFPCKQHGVIVGNLPTRVKPYLHILCGLLPPRSGVQVYS